MEWKNITVPTTNSTAAIWNAGLSLAGKIPFRWKITPDSIIQLKDSTNRMIEVNLLFTRKHSFFLLAVKRSMSFMLEIVFALKSITIKKISAKHPTVFCNALNENMIWNSLISTANKRRENREIPCERRSPNKIPHIREITPTQKEFKFVETNLNKLAKES